jgi:8-amino-3,8-dideoxy-alpha-D-manno-octulosonate transaminase
MPGYELIGASEKRNVLKLFKDKSNFYWGKTVKDFERAFKDKIGAGYAQSATSATAALKIAIEGLELPKGSEIITSAFTFVATAEAILEAGMVPVFAEINNTYNLDPADVRRKITNKTKAILPVHMYGSSVALDEIMKIAKENDLFVIEDCAQGLGAKYKGKSVGTFGDMGCFSFDAGKLLGTGDGGMVTSQQELYYTRAFEYVDHGHQNNPTLPRGRDTRRKYGFNYRMTELQAAVGLAQLERMDVILKKQRKNYERIMKKLKNPLLTFRTFNDEAHTYEAIIFSLPSREQAQELYAELKREGIVTKNLPDAYDWHFAGTWTHMGVKPGSFPITEDLLERSIAVMIFVKMNKEKIKKIIEVLNKEM